MNTEYEGSLRQVDYPGADQHASYFLLKGDLEHALQCVELSIAEGGNVTVQTALFSSAVIAYSRCFSGGSGTKLNREIFKGNPRNPTVFHDIVIGLRNKVYAHEELEISAAHFGPIVSETRPAKIFGYGNLAMKLMTFQKHDMKQFCELICMVLDHTNKKIAALDKKLAGVCQGFSEEELASLPVAELRAKALSEVSRK